MSAEDGLVVAAEHLALAVEQDGGESGPRHIGDSSRSPYPRESVEPQPLHQDRQDIAEGYEEKNLFRFLFQTDKFGGMDVVSLMGNPELSDIMNVMAVGLGCNEEEAREMFLTFFCVAHGLASLLANNSMEYDEEQSKKMLENVFFGMLASRKGR